MRTNKLDKLLQSIVEDYEYMTPEYKKECRQKLKTFLIGLINESETIAQLKSKVEEL